MEGVVEDVMDSYLDHVISQLRRTGDAMVDNIGHMYDPSRLVKRWKGRTFVIRKFSCHRDECGVCGKKLLTRAIVSSEISPWPVILVTSV